VLSNHAIASAQCTSFLLLMHQIRKVVGFVDKIDLKKALKNLYNPSTKEVTFVDVQP